MPTVRKLLVSAAIMATTTAALTLLAACGSESDAGSADGAGVSAAATTAETTTTELSVVEPSSTDASSAAADTTTESAADMIVTTVPNGTTVIDIQVGTNDATTLGGRTEEVELNAPVIIRITSDSDEEYHLHDYDIEQKAAAGVPAELSFTADKAGTFDLESHVTEDVLLTLVVT